MTPFLGLINLLERLTELRKTLNVYQIIKGRNTDEQADEVICKLRSGRVLSAGTSVPVELGWVTLPVWMFVPTWKLSESLTVGILWTLPHIGLWSVAQLCPTLCNPWTVACQAPLSMGFSRQEYWSGLPFPPGDLPHLGSNPCLLHWQADSLPLHCLGSPIPQVVMNR